MKMNKVSKDCEESRFSMKIEDEGKKVKREKKFVDFGLLKRLLKVIIK